MSKKVWGAFDDAFGSDEKVFTGGQLGKAVDKDDIDLEGMLKAMEILNKRARTMNKAQLYRLNYKLGLAVGKFREEVQKYITRPRESVKQGTLEKVHRANGNMDDAGLDERRETVIPRSGDGRRFMKVDNPGGKFGDAFGEDNEK